MLNSKNMHVLSDQQQDGGFKHFVTFGECAPWDTPDDECVECASESEAHKLKNIVSVICGEAETIPEMFPGTLDALSKLSIRA